MTDAPDPWAETWVALAARLPEGDPDPTQSLRELAETVSDTEAFPVETLPLLSVADDGAQGDLTPRELLGQGGMGKVELAIQRSLRREVAVKTTLARGRDHHAQALLHEALVTGLLEHPNIVPVHQLGRSDAGLPLLVMKRVEGVSWDALIRDPQHPHWARLGPDRLQEHLRILIAVCNAVEFAHARGILHRDIKPANVMVGAFGEVYLLDWGLAMRPDPASPSTAVVGTPAQMAPEMLDGAAHVTERTDVYLLGAALHTALTGAPRHEGSSLMNVCVSIFRSVPVTYPPEVPAELAELCNRATHVDPARRVESAAAMRQALERYLEHRSSVALATETQSRLEALRELLTASEPDLERLAALASACRFGFGQALRDWPENVLAQDGLSACLTLLIERALAQDDVGLAESLLGELPRPAPALAARVGALRQEQQARQARLRELEGQGDWRQGAGARLLLFLGLLGAGVGLWIWANGGRVRYEGTLTPAQLARSGAGVLAALGVMVWLGRGQLLRTRVNARLVQGALLTGAAIVVQRCANCLPAPPTAALISSEILLCGYGCAMGGLLLARWLWLPVPIWLAGAFAARLLPPYAGLCFAVSSLLALALGAWRLQREGSANQRKKPGALA